MQVVKYWRNKKLRYRLEGYPRQEQRAVDQPAAAKDADQDKRRALKREPMKLLP